VDVFISWSGDRSEQLALLLRDWLQQVVQGLAPWLSGKDIRPGRPWLHDLADKLDTTNQGIVCVTRDNLTAPWLNYEFGALAKSVGLAAVRPLLLDLPVSLLANHPIQHFQATLATDRDGMLNLMQSLNESCEKPIRESLLARTFDNAWAQFDSGVQQILQTPRPARSRGDLDGVLDELLTRVRTIHEALGLTDSSTGPQGPLPRINLGG
jgi:hypothetical protein